MREKLEELCKCTISLSRISGSPVLASDLRFYDSEYYQQLNPRNSPITRKPLIENDTFPVVFKSLENLIKNPTNSNLLKLATCPVTGNIMLNPMIAEVEYTDLFGEKTNFAIVCDNSALIQLPSLSDNFRKVQSREWDDLKQVTQILPKKPENHPQSRTALEQWETAFSNRNEFFTRYVPPAPVATNQSSNIYSSTQYQDQVRNIRTPQNQNENNTPTSRGG